jgi:hypothetical protein
MGRPNWWPKWIPEVCANGHVLEIGNVTKSWVFCDCPASDASGHHNWKCSTPGCRAQVKPPGCDRYLDQR